jgi:Na+/melibiose symporter-like transporter
MKRDRPDLGSVMSDNEKWIWFGGGLLFVAVALVLWLTGAQTSEVGLVFFIGIFFFVRARLAGLGEDPSKTKRIDEP